MQPGAARFDCGARLHLLLLRECSARPSKPMRPGSTPGGSATSHSSSWFRKTAFHAANAGSNPACDAKLQVSAGGSGGRFTKPACEGSTPSRDATALARGSSVAPPKRDCAVRLGTRAPQGSGNGVPVGLITRCQKRTRFDSEPCNRDEPRWHRRFICARARDRVSPSRPIRSRLTR